MASGHPFLMNVVSFDRRLDFRNASFLYLLLQIRVVFGYGA